MRVTTSGTDRLPFAADLRRAAIASWPRVDASMPSTSSSLSPPRTPAYDSTSRTGEYHDHVALCVHKRNTVCIERARAFANLPRVLDLCTELAHGFTWHDSISASVPVRMVRTNLCGCTVHLHGRDVVAEPVHKPWLRGKCKPITFDCVAHPTKGTIGTRAR